MISVVHLKNSDKVNRKVTLPADARKPDRKWRLYVFVPGQDDPQIIHIHRQTGILFGKDKAVCDIPVENPTCSKQHAVIHFRVNPKNGKVCPYLMDLDSTNGTFLNKARIEGSKYYELLEDDNIKFAKSSRDYVLMCAD